MILASVRREAEEKDDFIALGTLAQCLFDEGELDEAAKTFEAALSKVTEPPPRALRRAYAHYAASFATLLERRGDLERAEALYKLGLAANDSCPYCLGNYASMLQAARRSPAEVEAAYERAIQAHPTTLVSAMVKYGNFLRHVRRDPERAEAMFARALSCDPQHAEALTSCAVLLHALRPEDPQVGDLYARALAADPTGVNNISNYGLYLSEIKSDYAEASRLYEMALDVDPRHANSAYNYAVMLDAGLHDVPKAVQMYERAIKTQPKHSYALYNLAVVCEEKLEDLPRAQLLYRRAVEASPTDAMAMADLGRFLGQAEMAKDEPRFTEARALLHEALQIDSTSATAHAAFGQLALFEGDSPKAREHLRLATASDASNAAVRRLTDLLKDSKKHHQTSPQKDPHLVLKS